MDFLNLEFMEGVINSAVSTDSVAVIKDYRVDENVVQPGCNFNSRICLLNIWYIENGETKTIQFIMKIPSLSLIYNLVKDFHVYEKEKIMHNQVLPEMMKWIKGPWLVPRSYTSLHPEVLILEDLRSSGYRMVDRIKQLDLQHCLCAIKTIAQFHACSVKANSVVPEVMNKVKIDYLCSQKDSNKGNMIAQMLMFSTLIDIISKKLGKDNYYVSFLRKVEGNIWDDVSNLLKPKEDNFNVLNHGDYWTNNLAFKYDQKGNLVHLKTFDFQMCHWCGPYIDIWYLLVTSTQFEVFHENFNEILKVYIDTLNELLQSYSSPERYTIEQLEKDMKNSMLYGMSLIPMYLSTALADTKLDQTAMGTEEFIENSGLGAAMSEERFINVCCKWISYFGEQ